MEKCKKREMKNKEKRKKEAKSSEQV